MIIIPKPKLGIFAIKVFGDIINTNNEKYFQHTQGIVWSYHFYGWLILNRKLKIYVDA